MPADRSNPRRKKLSYIDLEPRLKRVDAQGTVQEDATGIGQARADYAIRLGLGDPDQIYYYRQCVMDPERAVQNPQLRPYVAEVAERALRLIFEDPQMWTRAQQLLKRKYPRQVYASMSEAAHNSLARRAGRASVPMDAVAEAWRRGLCEGGEQAAYARASSFIDGGRHDYDLRENFDLVAQHPRVRGQKFKAHAVSHDDVRKKIASLRRHHPDHYVTVHHRRTGMVHTLRKGEEYDSRLLENSNRALIAKVRRALGQD